MLKNKWRTAFIALASVVLIVIVVLIGSYHYYFPESEFARIPDQTSEEESFETTFSIQMKKDQLNEIINNELEKYSEKQENLGYSVNLNELATFQGYLTIFDRKVDFFLKFEPQVQPNGDLLLKEKAFQIGILELPSDKVLSFIKKQASLPPEITIDADEGTIYMAVSDLELKNGMKLRAQSFDLPNDQIIFDAYYPIN
ncbi:YpmS family protein [Alkalihalobacillus sp. CinArs1]|uniref:YpmS family protein n=1 Tax=Alkalihalobacillus sp. CinArs1 TaxID=2995314 RepID=UPI0022DE34E5|nr:YpmS family protein [Alkalihalobacillus sp. CinArs1]